LPENFKGQIRLVLRSTCTTRAGFLKISALFQPFKLKSSILRNGITVPPMRHYFATDGLINNWNLSQKALMARGAGLGGNRGQRRLHQRPHHVQLRRHLERGPAQAFVLLVQTLITAGSVPGLQIGHAGRMASANLP